MPGISLAQLQNTENLVVVHDANPPSVSTILVVVEGVEDKAIFERWFNDDIKSNAVVFNTPKSHSCIVDGCAGVVRIATSMRASSVPVYGIVDRDYLVTHHRSLFLEIDDAVFLQKNPHIPRVRVLTRWEIENYLVAPPVLFRLLADHLGDAEAQRLGVVGLEAIVEEVIDAVLLLTATNIALRDRGVKPFSPGWSSSDTLTLGDMERRLETDLFPAKMRPSERDAFLAERTEIVSALRAFGGGGSRTGSDYVRGMLRVVDGKAVLGRVLKKLNLQFNETKAKRTLASYMVRAPPSEGSVPRELVEHIEHFKQAVTAAR